MSGKNGTAGIRSFAKAAMKPVAFGVSALALGAGGAWAQELSDGPSNLPGVTVHGERVAVESPKYTAPILDTPQTITVVTSELMAQQNLLGLRDVLSTLPGITFGAGEGGGGYGDSINLRGYSANNDITVDGVRDSAQYSRTDPFNLEQIELVNGANSVYAGAGSVGGSVNIATKRPFDRDVSQVTVSGGTDNYARLTFDVNQTLTDAAALRLNFMAHQNDVPGRDVESRERWGIAPALSVDLGDRTQATLLLLHQEDDNIPEYGVPYALGPYNDGPLPGVDPSDYFGYSNVDTQETEVNSATLIVEHEFSSALSVRNLTRWQEVTQLAFVNPPQGTWCIDSGINPWTGAACADPGVYLPSGPRGSARDTSNEIFINQTDFTARFDTGGLAHTLVFGFSFSNENYHLDTGNVQRNPLGAAPNPILPPTAISNPDTIYTGPLNFIRTGYTDSELTNTAFYVFDRIEIGQRFEINGGVRFEQSETEAEAFAIATPYPAPPAAPVATSTGVAETDEDLLTYRIGFVYKPTENTNFYIAYGNSETPSQATVNGSCNVLTTCNVDPEEAQSFEVGAKWSAFDDRILLTAAAFRNERTNFRVNSGDPLVPEQQLDGQSRVDGVALGASGLITDAWSIFANYTFLDSEILQNIADNAIGGGAIDFQEGDPLPVTPEHSFSVWTTYELPFGLTIGYGVTYIGEYTFNRQNDATPLFYTDATWVHRAMARYDINERASLQLNVNNLFDEDYYTRIRNNATNGWATPADTRNAVLSLAYRF